MFLLFFAALNFHLIFTISAFTVTIVVVYRIPRNLTFFTLKKNWKPRLFLLFFWGALDTSICTCFGRKAI